MKFSKQSVVKSVLAATGVAVANGSWTVGGINCVGTTLDAGPNLEPARLEPNQWLCDPGNADTRFGMSMIGMPMHYVDGQLKWHVAGRGTSLELHTENTNLALHGEGMEKWTTACNSNAMGGSVVLTNEGEVQVMNGNDEVVWAITVDGQEYLGECIVSSEDQEEEEKDYAATPNDNEGGSGGDTNTHEIENKNIGQIVEDEIATVDIAQFTCVDDEMSAGNALLPTEYICDPNDDGNRFGLSFFGMPTFYKDNVLIWWKDLTGQRFVFQEDGHLVLEGKRPNDTPKWSSGCFDEEEVGSDNFAGGDVIQFVGGEVKIFDANAVLMWRLDAAAEESGCYPYGKKQTMNRASPFVCTGKAISADMALDVHEFICDPFNNGNRFGLGANGFAELYRGDVLMWRSEQNGNQLWFSYDDAELVLREEGVTKWTTGCKSDVTGKKVKFTPRGVKILDRSGDLVWALSHDGFESTCFPQGGGPDEEDDDDEEDAPIRLPDNCKGYSLKVDEYLGPNEFLCDPNNPSIRFGLSFVGMPQLLRGDQLVWFVPARGNKLVYQEDGHLVLYGEGAVKWSTNCYGKSRGRQIDFVGGGIDILDQDFNSVWRLDSNGFGSGCYPGPGAGARPKVSGL